MILFEGVWKSLGGRVVLKDVNFKVKRGDIFVIVGASGTGKSVTLKHMVRLLTPDSGRVVVDGVVMSEARGTALERVRSRFGYLFQGAALLQWLSALENVALPLRQQAVRRPEAEIMRISREKLRLVNLEEAADKFPADLSGGMQKRVGLARAIALDPEIVLYDEPTSGLDPVTARTIDRLIMNLRDTLGLTSVVVTHDLRSALDIGTQIAMIDRGEIVELATPQEFVRSKNAAVKQFLEADYITPKTVEERANLRE